MARPLRIPVAGGIYHLLARGNDRGQIFADDADRSEFLAIAAEVLGRFGWRCLTYCLMGNHYHLVALTPEENLSRGMRQLNGVYAQRYNRRHRRGGHLFGGRFHAVLVERDTHLLELARYVALNPVRAGLCARPEGWPWSAHRTLIGTAPNGIVDPGELLRLFGGPLDQARRRYRAFVAAGCEASYAPESEVIAGSDEYLAAHLPSMRPSPEIPQRHCRVPRPPLAEILRGDDAEQAIATAYRDHGYLLREIAEALGCHYSTVSRRLRAFEARTEKTTSPEMFHRKT